ncbi:hypothetical protein FBY40_1144 [Microbacterium sp. SLBN-154]|uniref:hypothetical protein n=1 Tax=Microbacterium sp. SLBN-154 TaxID=2768458 RepID=UPI001150366E|nr:hypothetical protein [Microbacterium sp. SLBN-154]TQK18655.1 hypothetical protein FBY40_1144 [Microbacterium sp. SLBN-154]
MASSLAPDPTTDEGRSAPLSYGVLWSRVEDGFYVANRDGVFLGYLDREADGTYRVFNGRSRLVGAAPDRRAAMDALLAHHDQEATA